MQWALALMQYNLVWTMLKVSRLHTQHHSDALLGWWSGDAQEEPKKDKLQLDPETERQLKEDLKKLKTEL